MAHYTQIKKEERAHKHQKSDCYNQPHRLLFRKNIKRQKNQIKYNASLAFRQFHKIMINNLDNASKIIKIGVNT